MFNQTTSDELKLSHILDNNLIHKRIIHSCLTRLAYVFVCFNLMILATFCILRFGYTIYVVRFKYVTSCEVINVYWQYSAHIWPLSETNLQF
jgi:hypothetical protein